MHAAANAFHTGMHSIDGLAEEPRLALAEGVLCI